MNGHTDWCAGGHRCGLGEHRADPVVALVGERSLVLTRVLARDGRQHVEVIASAPLPDHQGYAELAFVQIMDRLVGALGGYRPRV